MRPGTAETPRSASSPQASPLELRSSDFRDGGTLPPSATCDGQGISPQLAWTAPRGAKSFALIVDDPDAPNGTYVHWVMFDIPKSIISIARGATIGVSGRNSAGNDTFKAACPPPGTGTHRYRFHLYALDVESLGLLTGATSQQVQAAMQGHVLAESMLVGTCEHRRA
jgi:Raf kinase inhibitor-like YbhB/YbcL family protein